MSATENNVAAQTGDEPMRDAFEAHIRSRNPKELFVARWPDGSYKHHGTDGMWAGWQAAMASQVSPRATADVERDAARYRFMRKEATGNFIRFIPYGKPIEIDAAIDAAIATTKPGA